MKNKPTIIGLSIALAFTGMAAIAAPLAIHFTNQLKNVNLNWNDKAAVTTAIQTIVTDNQPESGYTDENNIQEVLNNNLVQVDMINQINASDKITSVYLMVKEIQGVGEAEKTYTITPSVAMKAGFLKTNELEDITGITADISVEISVDAESSTLLNADPAVTNATSADTLATVLNANKTLVASVIHNSYAIIIGDITVGAPTSAGFTITVPYTVKDGYDLDAGSALITGFKISVAVPALKANAAATLAGIDGVRDASDGNALQVVLNDNKTTVSTAIDRAHAISIGNIAVAAATADGFNISIPYNAANGFDVPTSAPPLTLSNFTITPDVPVLKSPTIVSSTLNEIDDVSTATDEVELADALNADKASVANAIENGDKINLGTIDVAAADPASNGYNITIPYTAKAGFIIEPGSLPFNGFKIDVTVGIATNAVETLNNITAVQAADDAETLRTALNTDAAKTTVATVITNNEKINITTIDVAAADPTTDGFDITINYTSKPGFNVTGALVINDFKINVTVGFEENHLEILNRISGVNTATDATTLAGALNTGNARVLTAISNRHAINNLETITVANATEGVGFNITIPYTAKAGFNVTPTNLVINNFIPNLTFDFTEIDLLAPLNEYLSNRPETQTPELLRDLIDTDANKNILLRDYINTLGLTNASDGLIISTITINRIDDTNQYTMTFTFSGLTNFTVAPLVLTGIIYNAPVTPTI